MAIRAGADLRSGFEIADAAAVVERAEENFQFSLSQLAANVDRMMVWLLALEWLGMMGAALVISPTVWSGAEKGIHPHLLAAVLAGPAFILPTIAIALLCPARPLTRHVIATAQMLVSSLLIDCTGGRIETHFHVFGSLAFLAFYRDWRVLLTASAITAADHVARGFWWPQSIYGVLSVSPWRWVEHAWWVLFEDFFLFVATRNSVRDMRVFALTRARLYTGANYDALTGLGNRHLLQAKFDSWVRAGQDAKGALLFVDLDRFKQANDTYGHTAGDRLLTMAAERFREVVGTAGTLARIGGDEFVVLCEAEAGIAEAGPLAARLLESLTAPFAVEGHELTLSASIGISLFPGHGTTLAELQEKADLAMYAAKSQGRNRSVAFSAETSAHDEMVRAIKRDLPGALTRGEFHLHFQPVVQRDGQLQGFEALLRWHHPIYGAIAPTEFIPLAEKSGDILTLGDWVLTEACRTCLSWQTTGEAGVGVAVNVSAVQFDQPCYPDRVLAAVAKSGLAASLLTLEVTEGVLMRDIARARRNLEQLRCEGIHIALDDFGTGYSSLGYLRQLPVDSIKLDRTFLTDQLPASTVIVGSIVNLAHRLGLQVVAEGVESQAEMTGLLDLDCDQFQGYFFSRPVPAGAAADMLRINVARNSVRNQPAVELISVGGRQPTRSRRAELGPQLAWSATEAGAVSPTAPASVAMR